MKLLLSFFVLVLPSLASAKGELIYIDPGHTLEFPGVTGTCGSREVWLNDHVALELEAVLKAGGYRVAFTRTPNTDITKIAPQSGRESAESLRARGERANKAGAALFISLHHDSMKEEELLEAPDACPGIAVTEVPRLINPVFLESYNVGFNVFIHPAAPAGRKFIRSLRLAKLIGQAFIEAGEQPADFHTKEVEPDCTSCKFEDKALGVMSRNLGVIRGPVMPAMLVEITNLRLIELEKKANDPAYQKHIALLLRKAIDAYFGVKK